MASQGSPFAGFLISCLFLTVMGAQALKSNATLREPALKGDIHAMNDVYVIEGDIAMNYDRSRPRPRNAVSGTRQLWSKGRIPYIIDRSLSYQANDIRRAMNHIMENTCIVFTPRRREFDYVNIYRGPNGWCWSRVGRQGGGQQLSLGSGCHSHGVIVHELMHTIGFWHMHNRSDRDQYLKIMWGNILGNRKHEFQKNHPNANRILTRFDYNSIMLYGPRLFSFNGRSTMVPRQGRVNLQDTANKRYLSQMDKTNINLLYGCGSKKFYNKGKGKDGGRGRGKGKSKGK